MLNRIKNFFHIKNDSTECSTYDKIESLFDSLHNEVVFIEIGEDLINFKYVLIDVIGVLREQIKDECGFIMPLIGIRENYANQENELKIYIQEKVAETRFVIPTEIGIKEEVYECLKTVIYDHLDSVFTNELTEKYINTVKKSNNLLVWNVTNILSVIDIKTILSDIIFNGKSIQNINYIFEKIGEYILSEGINPNNGKKYDPHTISQAISKYLYK